MFESIFLEISLYLSFPSLDETLQGEKNIFSTLKFKEFVLVIVKVGIKFSAFFVQDELHFADNLLVSTFNLIPRSPWFFPE